MAGKNNEVFKKEVTLGLVIKICTYFLTMEVKSSDSRHITKVESIKIRNGIDLGNRMRNRKKSFME